MELAGLKRTLGASGLSGLMVLLMGCNGFFVRPGSGDHNHGFVDGGLCVCREREQHSE